MNRDAIDVVAHRLDVNISHYKSQRPVEGAKQAAYECARILHDLDDEIGHEAVKHLRENGL